MASRAALVVAVTAASLVSLAGVAVAGTAAYVGARTVLDLGADNGRGSDQNAVADLAEPITFAPVSHFEDGPCPDDVPGAYEDPDSGCVITFVEDSLTVDTGTVEYVSAEGGVNDINSIVISLDRAHDAGLADLTSLLVGLEDPQNRMAVIVEDEILTMPTVMAPIADGMVTISAHEQAKDLFDQLAQE